MAINLIDNREYWDSIVESNQYSMIFHKWDFLKTMEKYSGYTFQPYGIYGKNKEELMAILPLFIQRKFGFNIVVSQPPQTGVSHLGLLLIPRYFTAKQRKKERFLNTVVKEIGREVHRIKPNYLSISLGPAIKDTRPFVWNNYSVKIYYTYVIHLNRPIDIIWDRFSREFKKGVRSASKFELSIMETTNVETFCDILNMRYHQQGLTSPLMSPAYLKDLLSIFPEHIKMFFLYNKNKIINLMLTCAYKKRFSFWMGGVSLDRGIHSYEYYAWELIKKAKIEGFDSLELSGANTERLCYSKSKLDPSLDFCFEVFKKDIQGKMAEYIYLNFIRRY